MTTRRRVRRSCLVLAVIATASGAAVASRVTDAGALRSSTTHLTKAPFNQTVGNPETLIARVGGRGAVPTGTVQFYEGATPVGSPASVVDRVATLTYLFDRGTHTVSATYSGDTNFAPSSSTTITFIVGDPSATKSVLLYKAIPAAPVTSWTPTTHVLFTGNVGIAAQNINYGPRTGTATFVLDGNQYTVTLSSSRVIFDVPGGLGPGTHTANFTYHGDIHYKPSTAGTRTIKIVNG